jgi:hypothetical protein
LRLLQSIQILYFEYIQCLNNVVYTHTVLICHEFEGKVWFLKSQKRFFISCLYVSPLTDRPWLRKCSGCAWHLSWPTS